MYKKTINTDHMSNTFVSFDTIKMFEQLPSESFFQINSAMKNFPTLTKALENDVVGIQINARILNKRTITPTQPTLIIKSKTQLYNQNLSTFHKTKTSKYALNAYSLLFENEINDDNHHIKNSGWNRKPGEKSGNRSVFFFNSFIAFIDTRFSESNREKPVFYTENSSFSSHEKLEIVPHYQKIFEYLRNPITHLN